MKKLYKLTDAGAVLKHVLVFFAFIVFNALEKEFYPYSVAIYSTCVFGAFSYFSVSALFLLAIFLGNGANALLPMAISSIFFGLVKLLYKKTNTKIKHLSAIFTLIAMIPFIILGSSDYFISYEKRILVSLVCSFLTLIGTIAVNAVSSKGLKYKMTYEEVLSITACVILIGIGVSRLVSPLMWKGIAIFLALMVGYLYKSGTVPLVACILGAGLAIFYGNIGYFSIGLVWGLTIEITMRFSRFLSSMCIPLADYLAFTIFEIVGYYSMTEFLPVLIGACAFAVLPTKPLELLKEKLYAFREKHLVRQSINRNKLMLSNKLYEISGVFNEISSAFSTFKEAQTSLSQTKKRMMDELRNDICKNCENKIKCKKYEKELLEDFSKMIEIGVAKGKLSLIDFPINLSHTCIRSSELIFLLNKMLANHKSYMQNAITVNSTRDLIASETKGVAEILKGLALEEGALLKYQNRLERTLADALQKAGFIVSELIIYGENESLNVCMILCMKEFSLKQILAVLKEKTGIDLELVDKNSVTDEKCFLSFKKSAPRDAVFGVASTTKDGSTASGDTHSVIRINEDKFLVALSDGMGSGENAKNVSSVALSLIESFYKAGMKSELILSTVNKLLSVNTEDSFTALDVSVIDLNVGKADFIKYGSPYGFIINDNGVRIIEAGTLPLGILEDLTPSVCSTALSNGDMILLVTDGISDAFKSSNEIIDFLRKIPAKNPQSLADDVLAEALNLSGGKKCDDMTALAVRIFDKNKSA